jgi:hypothetical protein
MRENVRLGITLLCASLAWTPDSWAQGAAQDPAAARSLFDEAKALVGSNRAAEACPKFEESYRLDAGIGTQFNLADCYERVGKTASAWSAFLGVAAKASAAGQTSRETVARERAAALAPKLSKLTITVPPASRVAGLSIERDGVSLGEPSWGSAVVVDPGKHRVVASAPGRKRWVGDIEVAPDAGAATLSVPSLELESAKTPAEVVATPAPTAAVAASPSAEADRGEHSERGRGSLQRTGGVVAAGLGVVGLGLGTWFGLSSRSKADDVKGHCVSYPSGCDAEGLALNDDAKKAGTLSTVSFVTGGVLIAAGVVLYLTAPSSSQNNVAAPSIRLAPALGQGSAGGVVQGQF